MANMLMMRYAAKRGDENQQGDDYARMGGSMNYPMPAEMRRRRDSRGRYMEGDDGPEMSAYGGNEPRRYAGYERRNGDYEPPMGHYGHNASDKQESPQRGISGGFWMDNPKQSHHKPERLTMEQAEEWVEGMHNTDPAKPNGGKWKMDEVKLYAQKAGIPPEGPEFQDFWVAMNAVYSDYYEVAKKYGVANPAFFADMAKAFIQDDDAEDNKTALYYEYIVKK